MGLDIHALSNCKLVENPNEEDEYHLTHVYACPDFPNHFAGMQEGYYDGEGCDVDFSMGYIGYSYFRDELAKRDMSQ